MALNDIRREMYTRQIMLKEIGEEGQLKLAEASVLVAGCGGLGSSALTYLAASGIGHLGLCDYDTVTLSNLNRQILYTTNDAGKQKAGIADKRLRAINPELKTTVYDEPMDEQLAKRVIKGYDIVVDCLDNFQIRFIVNDECISADKPLVHAGVGEFYGQLMTIIPGKSPCLRCLFPDGIRTNAKNNSVEPVTGVIGPVPGMMGSMQALEVIKYLLGLPVSCDGLVTYNGITQSTEKVEVKQAVNCICSK